MIQFIEPNRIDKPITDMAATTVSRTQPDPKKNETMLSGSTARMVCVLTLLAASMVGGSAVLAWLEPKPGYAAVSPAMQREQAQVAVAGTRDPVRRWNSVTLIQVDDSQSLRRNTLTALSDPGEAHFLILSGGAIRALPSWYNQSAIGGDNDLKIGVNDLDDPPQAQRRALSALLSALQPFLPDDTAIEASFLASRSNS